MSHSPCVIGVRSAAATLPARRWADMVDEDCTLPAFIPRTPPDELSALPGGGQVSYQLPAVSETTETWLPAKSTVVDTAPRSAPILQSFQSFSSASFGGTTGLFMLVDCAQPLSSPQGRRRSETKSPHSPPCTECGDLSLEVRPWPPRSGVVAQTRECAS